MDTLLRAAGGPETGAGCLHPGGHPLERLSEIRASPLEPRMQAKVHKLTPAFCKSGPVFTKPGTGNPKLTQ